MQPNLNLEVLIHNIENPVAGLLNCLKLLDKMHTNGEDIDKLCELLENTSKEILNRVKGLNRQINK